MEENTSRKKRLTLMAIIIAVIVMVLVCFFLGKPLIKFASEPEMFREWIDGNGLLGRLAFIGIIIFQVIFAFIPGEPFEIVAGYAFGTVEGTLLCVIGSAIGSMLVFALTRRYGIRLLEVFFSKEKIESLKFLKTTPNRNFLFFVIFAIPGTPKDLLAYFAGITDMKWWLWLIICSAGKIPSIITSTIGGDALNGRNYKAAIIVLVITIVLAAVGLLVYNLIKKRKNAVGETDEDSNGNS